MLPSDVNAELLKQQDDHQFELAKLNLQLNAENNKTWANHWFKMRILTMVSIGVLLVIILAFCAFAMYMDHADIAIKIIEGTILFAAGNGTGYAIKSKLDSLKEKQR